MNEDLLKRIKKRLNAKFYIMNDAWLRDCVEFFIRSKNPNDMTDKHIMEFVEGQWQLSDLREINNEKGCLPKNLVQQVRIVLPSTYILQVDKMFDISSSKYKQLCEVQKISNENVEITEKETLLDREPKAKRMLQLYLTDGVQDITAIEYVPLRQLTSTLLPGYKVMIIGPVDCRRGIILLEPGKYKEVGGEVESLLKSNALENVLARTLGKPENPDPYNDNGSSIQMIKDQNVPIDSNSNSDNNLGNNEDSFFDDDFEQAIDFDAVTAIEKKQTVETSKETKNAMEEAFEVMDFEPLENWSYNSPMKPLRALPAPETEGYKDDIIIIKDTSSSTSDFRGKPYSVTSVKNRDVVEFPEDDFDFDDCELAFSSTASTSKAVQKMPQSKMISHLMPRPKKICDVLSDVLRETITSTIYRTVRGQVKNHSALTKQGKCWAVTALIMDHTSSVEVCFDSEILERFLGFTVQEFSLKKKLAKSDPQISNELRLNLRKAQHQIESLDALLELKLSEGEMPKVVNITQLTTQQKEELNKNVK